VRGAGITDIDRTQCVLFGIQNRTPGSYLAVCRLGVRDPRLASLKPIGRSLSFLSCKIGRLVHSWQEDGASLNPIGHSSSFFSCKIGRLVPIWQEDGASLKPIGHSLSFFSCKIGRLIPISPVPGGWTGRCAAGGGAPPRRLGRRRRTDRLAGAAAGLRPSHRQGAPARRTHGPAGAATAPAR
jgi:hypothetical protein